MNGLGGVDTHLADAIRQASRIISKAIPGVALRVTSGYRSEEKQEDLRRMWASGDRAGLTSEPARYSRHTQGRAVDLGLSWRGRPVAVTDTPQDYFELIEYVLEPAGIRRLGLNHYELI